MGTEGVAFGTMLAGRHVIDALLEVFESDVSNTLEARLLHGLEAARASGGMMQKNARLPERSAGVVVFGDQTYSDIDLRVDLAEGAVARLREIYDEFKLYDAYYEERAKNPRAALPQFEFADMLHKQRPEGSPHSKEGK